MSLRPDPNNIPISMLSKDAVSSEQPTAEYGANLSESVIWDDFRNGNEKSLTFIYSRYIKDLYNYGSQFTRNHELVKDGIQDLFIELIRNKKNLGPTTSIKFYLYKALRRKLVRTLQKQTKLFFTDNLQIHDGFFVTVSPELTLLRSQLGEEQKTLLEKSINALTVSQREAILLYFYEGLSYAEISKVMEIGKVKSTRALLYRAISAMAEFLAPYKSNLIPSVLLQFIFALK